MLLLQRFILGRHLRKEILYCIYDESKSIINYKDFGKDYPSSRRKPTPPDITIILITFRRYGVG